MKHTQIKSANEALAQALEPQGAEGEQLARFLRFADIMKKLEQNVVDLTDFATLVG